MARMVAFLRGVNVGGKQIVSMDRLRAIAGGLGLEDVATLLQSGNLIFTTSLAPPAVGKQLEAGITAEFGHDVAVVVRDADEIATVLRANPFGKVATDPSRQLVMFLSAPPAEAKWKAFEPEKYAPEQFVLVGKEIHMWCPDGLGRSKLGQAMTSNRLGVVATGRNWRTVLKVNDLLG